MWEDRIAPERLLGLLQTVWKPTLNTSRTRHVEATKAAGRAIAGWKDR